MKVAFLLVWFLIDLEWLCLSLDSLGCFVDLIRIITRHLFYYIWLAFPVDTDNIFWSHLKFGYILSIWIGCTTKIHNLTELLVNTIEVRWTHVIMKPIWKDCAFWTKELNKIFHVCENIDLEPKVIIRPNIFLIKFYWKISYIMIIIFFRFIVTKL